MINTKLAPGGLDVAANVLERDGAVVPLEENTHKVQEAGRVEAFFALGQRPPLSAE